MKRRPHKIDTVYAYRLVIEYARKQIDPEPEVKLLFGVLRQSIQDIATESDPYILSTALEFLQGPRLQDLCDNVGLDRVGLLESIHKAMQPDVDEAKRIVGKAPLLRLDRLEDEE